MPEAPSRLAALAERGFTCSRGSARTPSPPIRETNDFLRERRASLCPHAVPGARPKDLASARTAPFVARSAPRPQSAQADFAPFPRRIDSLQGPERRAWFLADLPPGSAQAPRAKARGWKCHKPRLGSLRSPNGASPARVGSARTPSPLRETNDFLRERRASHCPHAVPGARPKDLASARTAPFVARSALRPQSAQADFAPFPRRIHSLQDRRPSGRASE
jgi:hypothetical protein